MRVATWRGGATFTIDEAPDPVPRPSEVLVEVDTVGICGTDVHITQGLFPGTPPAVLGHEFAGKIVDAGDVAGRARVGEMVVCNLSTSCGYCDECLDGRVHRCINTERIAGAYAEYVAVPAEVAIPVPDGLEPEIAALTEPASCCLSGAEMTHFPEDAVAVIIGGGVMGLFSMAFARLQGAAVTILSEPVASRREMAKQMGADIVHDPGQSDLKEVVEDATGGRGAHVAIEAVGKPELIARCVELTRPRGSVLIIGVAPQGSTLPYDLYDFHYREITLRGAFGRGGVFEKTLGLLPQLNLDGIISGRFPLSRIADGIAASAQGEGVKFTVRPNMPE